MKICDTIRWILMSGLLMVFSIIGQAGHLPTKSYTTFDGLANDSVNKIVRDSRGFLWFCTGEGLSRFDGFEFKNYTQNDGLPHRNINDFLETKDGDLLLGTNGGLAIFNPNGKSYKWNIIASKLEQNSDEAPMFQTATPPNTENQLIAKSILSLAKSEDGRIFAGTLLGLFQLSKADITWTYTKINSSLFQLNTEFGALKFDSFGYLWMATSTGIYRMSPDGNVSRLDIEGGGSVLADTEGKIWIGASGTPAGLRVFSISADGQNVQLRNIFRMADGLPRDSAMLGLLQTSDGRILILFDDVLCEFSQRASEQKTKFASIAHGLFQSLAEDPGGNIWIGTVQEGALKLVPSGFVKFDESDGILNAGISSLFVNPSDDIFATSGKQTIYKFSNGKFEAVSPKGETRRSWSIGQVDFQSKSGDWWIPTQTGLRVYSNPKSFEDLAIATPRKIYTIADGLYGNHIFNMFESSVGDIWISVVDDTNGLQRLEKSTGKIIRYSIEDGLPKSNGAVAFGEDLEGNIWIGFYSGGLARFKNNQFQFFTENDGIPPGTLRKIFFDRAGRLWLASFGRGIFLADNPLAEKPHFTNLSIADGLSSNQANCVTEDDFGQIYVGTGKGINRIDPISGHIKLYTQADGLPGSVIDYCVRQKDGTLWFESRNSLVKYTPQPEIPLKSSAIFIGGITANGIQQKISELGTEMVEDLKFTSDQRQIKIDFFALSFQTGNRLQYQYKLDNQDWSKPDEQKSLSFNLSAGEYQFAVRAVNADGIVSENPATVSFTIAQPVWKRWWFLLIASIFIGGIILTIERTRAARVRNLKLAFDQLSVSEQRFRRMIEQSSLGFVIFAPDGSLRSVNPAYENFWNVKFDQIKEWKMLEDQQLLKSGVSEKLKKAFEGKNVFVPPVAFDPRKNELGVLVDPNSKPRWIQSFAYPIKSESGELMEVIMVMEDITEAKTSEVKLQQVREDRLRELEQVRLRIAADLHDDIGSSLTQISIFSEVLQQRIDKTNMTVLEPLEFIASSSRELIDSMSDIVWAINPHKDFVSELSGKMHRFAADLFSITNITLKYYASPATIDLTLGANIRREMFLIFKESVNNIVKHANCNNVEIELSITKSEIILTIQDDGKGFDTDQKDFGNGLSSMAARAKGLEGKLEIVSGNEIGTTMILAVPIQNN